MHENTILRSGPDGNTVAGIDFGSIIKAYDDDGDFVSLTGKFTINILDDVPNAVLTRENASRMTRRTTGRAITKPTISARRACRTLSGTCSAISRTPARPATIPTSIRPAGLGTNKQVIGYARDQVVSTSDTEVGADAPALNQSIVMKIVGGEGVASGLFTTEGNAIYLFTTASGLIVGKVDKCQRARSPLRSRLNSTAMFPSRSICR